MPGRNGTGPEGEGAKTGRSLGNCGSNASNDIRDENRQGLGRGLGNGRGRGQGLGQGGRGRGRS